MAQFDITNAFITVQHGTLDVYSDEVRLDLAATLDALGTNALAKVTSNQIVRATNALDRADEMTNSTSRARALSAAVNKLYAVLTQVWRTQTAPHVLARNTDLVEDDPSESDTTRFFLTVTFPEDHPEGYFAFTSDKPEEVGLWSYERTGAHTGLIHLNVNFAEEPYVPFNHDLTLTFGTPRSGTFTGQNAAHTNIHGTFVVH